MHMRKTLSTIVPVLMMTACTTGFENLILHEEGPKPSLEQTRSFILQDLHRGLRDPESLKSFSIISGPEIVTGITAGRAQEKAWIVCVEYNAKNAYGGYTGISTHEYILRFSGESLSKISKINWISQSRTC